MSRKRPKVGEIHWGSKPESSPKGTFWYLDGKLNENRHGRWVLVKAVDYEKDTDLPFILPPEFNTPRKGTEGTQTTYFGKIEGEGPEKK
jgi:hypothetical protein